ICEKEGLLQVRGLLKGKEPPELLEIQEGPCRFLVDIRNGQKTGFFTDQRDNRSLIFHSCKNAGVLDCFCYTGGFTVNALMGGAKHVTSIDASESALALLRKNAVLNHLDTGKSETAEGDVFSILREFRNSGRQFDVLILDPPKFADAKKYLTAAARAYKDINLLGFKLLRPGGFLFTFSCSGLMDADLFQKIVADAALDAGREAHIIRRLSQAEDHPVSLNFPEGTYLKGLQCRVMS
ncbi:MAG: class I SAM-dependent rRNA methyltransferase, partial [Desulfococcaceae bacterium]